MSKALYCLNCKRLVSHAWEPGEPVTSEYTEDHEGDCAGVARGSIAFSYEVPA